MTFLIDKGQDDATPGTEAYPETSVIQQISFYCGSSYYI